MPVVICFDIGIRNLAWCAYDTVTKKIKAWHNYDLVADNDVNTVIENNKCSVCLKTKATFTVDSKLYCARHSIKPLYKDLSGNRLNSTPSHKMLKEVFQSKKPKKELLEKFYEKYATPIEKKKTVKKAFDMTSLHDSIRKFVLQFKDVFSTAQIIGLENQPVLKNPVMKTVQVLLFATLRDILQPSPPKLSLIHASKKTESSNETNDEEEEIEKGDAGYAKRKRAGVERAEAFLKEHPQGDFNKFFDESKKQNDLSDSLAMCLDLANKL